MLVNGGKLDQFKPSRESPYLFILGQEVLSRILDKEFRDGNISSAKPSIRGLALMPIMYADDIVLFSKATRNYAKRLANCLEKYCTLLGKIINRGKSGILFSKHTGPNRKRAMSSNLT